MTLSQKFDKPIISLFITLVLYGAFIGLFLLKTHFEFSVFICAGEQFINPEVTKGRPSYILKNNTGYDGQFYYRLAINPFSIRDEGYPVLLDYPAYRYQRIIYPLLTYLLKNIGNIPIDVALILINYFCLGIISYFGAIYAKHFQRHAIWGAVISLSGIFLFSLSRDLTEIVELCFLQMALLAHIKQHRLFAGILFSVAILSKETALLVPVAIVSYAVFRAYRLKDFKIFFKEKYMCLPIIVFFLWRFYIANIWGGAFIVGVNDNISFPLNGVSKLLSSIKFPIGDYYEPLILELFLIAMMVGIGYWKIIRRGIGSSIHLSWLFYTVLIFSASYAVWQEDWAFMRAAGELWMLSILMIVMSKYRFNRLKTGLGLTFILAIWLYLAQNIIRFRL